MKKYKVTLQKEERSRLEAIAQKGRHKSEKVLNGLVLLNCGEGEFQDHPIKNEEIASVLRVSSKPTLWLSVVPPRLRDLHAGHYVSRRIGRRSSGISRAFPMRPFVGF